MVSLVQKDKSSPRLTYKGGLWPARPMDQWDRHKQRLQQFCLSPGRDQLSETGRYKGRSQAGLWEDRLFTSSLSGPLYSAHQPMWERRHHEGICVHLHTLCVLSCTIICTKSTHPERREPVLIPGETFLWRTSHEPSLKKDIKPLGPGTSLLYRRHSYGSWSISEASTTIVWCVWETRYTYKRVSTARPRQSIQGIIHYKACLGHFKHTTGI